jgi:glycosyltransferase involved in cell wall biosynthesis
MSSDSPGITAFFPAYNDGGTIASMVISAMLVLEGLTDDYEVIVVNDGSRDYTPEILDRLAADYPQVRVIHHPQNRGYGGALRTGFASASKELIFYTDGDAQYDVRDLRNLWPLMTDAVDVVQGYKRKRHDPWYREIMGRTYHLTVRLMFGLELRDVDCDFRLMRRCVFDKVKLESDSGVICLEMMKKVQDHGFRIVEAPVSHYHRSYGKSQFFNLRRIWRLGFQVLSWWWRLVIKKEHLATEPTPSPEFAPAGDPAAQETIPR